MELSEKHFGFVEKEIEQTYGQIDKQRDSTTAFLKIYLSIIVGLFAYIYFIENRLLVNGKRINTPNTDYIIFGLFGIIICLIAFIIGWALLDNVTKTVYKSIKNYKHISYLRYLISTSFPNDCLANNSILPMKQNLVPMRISAQVPIIGGLFNFGLLLLNYYFLSLFVTFEYSVLFSTMIMTLISIFYSNQLEKHFEEILIAQKLRPKRDEIILKKSVGVFVRQRKKMKNYVYTTRLYKLAILFLVITFSIFIIYLNQPAVILINKKVIFAPTTIFLISLIPRYFMGRHRIESINCFPEQQSLFKQ